MKYMVTIRREDGSGPTFTLQVEADNYPAGLELAKSELQKTLKELTGG